MEKKSLKPEIINRIQDAAKELYHSMNMLDYVHIFLHDGEMNAGDAFEAGTQRIVVPRKSAVVFADLEPNRNWGHRCQHLLYDLDDDKNGIYERIDSKFPALDIGKSTQFKLIHQPVQSRLMPRMTGPEISPAGLIKKNGAGVVGTRLVGNDGSTPGQKPMPIIANVTEGERYAILFSGCSNYRHLNDLEFMYRTLVDVYGFNEDNIYLLYFNNTLEHWYSSDHPEVDGKHHTNEPVDARSSDDTTYYSHPKDNKWPGNNDPFGEKESYRLEKRLVGPGTRKAFDDTIDALKSRIGPNDFLFIHTNNHGDYDYSRVSRILCYDPNYPNNYFHSEKYSAKDFGKKLSELPAFKTLLVMMEQCFSGGFKEAVLGLNNAQCIAFTASCEPDKTSNGGCCFDSFTYDWICAMNGASLDARGLVTTTDINSDNQVSAFEAYSYAKQAATINNTDDSPVWGCKPSDDTGDHMFLGRVFYQDAATPPVSSPSQTPTLPESKNKDNISLYIRDSTSDTGKVRGDGIRRSPDIIVFTAELENPNDSLGTAESLKEDDLGESDLMAADNYIYVRVYNGGKEVQSGTVSLYWSKYVSFPHPSQWNLIGDANIPSTPPGGHNVIGPIKWQQSDIPGPDRYCFIAIVNQGLQVEIHTPEDYYDFMHKSIAAWKDFSVKKPGDTSGTFTFRLQGWKESDTIRSDLAIDLTSMAGDVEIQLKVWKEICRSSTCEDMSPDSSTQNYNKYKVKPGRVSYLKGLSLSDLDNYVTTLKLPANALNGDRIIVQQLVDGKGMGAITIKAVPD